MKNKNKNLKHKISNYFGYASENNQVILIMYYLSYPAVLFFEKINFKPNHVTLLSIFFSILSFVFLVYDQNIYLFSLAFFISQLLDHCDGTLARKTNQLSKHIINPDKISDLIKIFLTHFAISIYFDQGLIWILSSISMFLFLFFVILELMIQKRKSSKKKKVLLLRNKFTFTQSIYKLFFLGPIIKFIYRFCTTLNAQAVLVFIIAPLNYNVCLYVFIYFIFVVSFNLIRTFNQIKFFKLYG